ncbi:DUF4258 domain-containing protein [Bdellovibrionota bacterium FG-2]
MKPLRFTAHAFQRMFERAISPRECEDVFLSSKIIETYPDDKPFPSELRVGRSDDKVIHIVVAETADSIHVITAYIPDPTLWSLDFYIRRKKRGSP